ncbi:MAG: class GN sortase [Halieaceae bacterium]|jgi:sortase A|nr:class GN sortase [Halieaceae bacterium]
MFRLCRFKNVRALLILSLLMAGCVQLSNAGYIHAKAQLAQILIARAWEKTLILGGEPKKPWPWADTWPVARLQVPRLQIDLFVLSGAAGHALAFGPGHESASAIPGMPGIAVIGGHRDTHFRFLQDLRRNTLLSLQLASGKHLSYRVDSTRIINTDSDPYLHKASDRSELQLVTCYPFDALAAGGPLRYVVSALPLAALDNRDLI